MLYQFLKIILWFLVAVIIKPKIIGRENISFKDPIIIASNHLDTLDAILLIIVFPFKLHLMVKEDNHPIMRWLIQAFLSGYTVRRFLKREPESLRDGNPDAFHRSDKLLREGKAIYIWPEGHRSETVKLREAKGGVGIVARRNPQAQIVPVGIIGTKGITQGNVLKVLLNLWSCFRSKEEKIKLIIGSPFSLSEEERRLTSREVADLIMIKIGLLLPEEMWGEYSAQIKQRLALN